MSRTPHSGSLLPGRLHAIGEVNGFQIRPGLFLSNGATLVPGGERLGRTYHARVVEDTFDWGPVRNPRIPFSDMIIYEMRVRGFTKHASSQVKFPGTFAGLEEKIPYLLELGVNAVELMPVFEFDE